MRSSSSFILYLNTLVIVVSGRLLAQVSAATPDFRYRELT